MSELEKGLGRQISRLRKEKGLTQAQLAEAIGVAVETISRLERGFSIPSLNTIEEISKKLGVSVKDIFDFEYRAEQKSQAEKEISKIVGLLSGKHPEEIRMGYQMLREFYKIMKNK